MTIPLLGQEAKGEESAPSPSPFGKEVGKEGKAGEKFGGEKEMKIEVQPGLRSFSFVEGDSRIFLYLGGVHVAFGETELWADNVVVWCDRDQTAPERLAGAEGDFRFSLSTPFRDSEKNEGRGPYLTPLGSGSRRIGGKVGGKGQIEVFVPEIYAEGNVRVLSGTKTSISASRLYFNMKENRGVIVDGEFRTDVIIHEKHNPLMLRAAEIRELSVEYAAAKDARVSTCTFSKPHYFFRAREIALKGKPSGGTLALEGTSFVAGGISLPLPDMSCALGEEWPIPLRRLRFGRSTKFGVTMESLWGKDMDGAGRAVHGLLGIDRPFHGDWFLNLNVYGRRGVMFGPGIDYRSPDLYRGYIKSYYIEDKAGHDLKIGPIENEDRGWIQSRNRINLPDFWLLDLELSYISERHFLLEYFEDELREEKKQETLAYFHKAHDSHFLSLLTNARINDFQTETEHLPEARWFLSQIPLINREGTSIGEGGMVFHNLYYRQKLTASQLRYRHSDQVKNPSPLPEERLGRADYLGAIEAPFNFGPFKLVPYLEQRISWFEKTRVDGNNDYRYISGGGATASVLLSRVSETNCDFLNIHGLRHVLEPSIGYRNNFHADPKATDLYGFDSIEDATDDEAVLIGLRHRMQTRDEKGEVTTFLEGFYSISAYPDKKWSPKGKHWGDFDFDVYWTPDLPYPFLENLFLNEEGDFDVYDNDLNRINSLFVLKPYPAFQLRASHRWIRNTHSFGNLGLVYVLTPRWEMELEFRRNLKTHDWMREGVVFRRRAHQWVFEFEIAVDNSDGNHSISFSIMPLSLFGKGPMGSFYEPSRED